MLQETHSTLENEDLWTKEWGGKIWFCHGTSQSKGVAILLSRRIQDAIQIDKVQMALDGRLIIANMVIGETELVLSNLYGPNEDDAEFYVNAFDIIEKNDNPNMILCGDFNTALDPLLDTRCSTDQHKRKREVIKNYLELRDLVDVWRTANPEKYQYTWKRDQQAQISSRIDYFFVSQGLCNRILDTDILPGYKSDHWRLQTSFNFEDHPRGRGFWKFNTSYLRDKQFLEELNLIVDQYLWAVKENISPAQEWEYLKLEISSFCVEYANRKAKQRNRLIDKLIQRLKILDERLLDSQSQDTRENLAFRIKQTEQFLINEHEKLAEKQAFHNKCKYYTEGERNNKFFFNLAKAKYNSKVVRKIKDSNGNIYSNPKDVLREQAGFYESLFKESDYNRDFNYTNQGNKLS